MNRNDELDRLIESGAVRRISRRELLQRVGLGAGAAVLLAACGVSGEDDEQSGQEAANIWDTAEKTGTLNFANWPLYIDKARQGGEVVHPSLELFTKETDIEVNYDEVIQENESFFGQIRPSLEAGQDTGYDLMVITNGQVLSNMILLDYLVPLDKGYLGNFEKYAGETYKDPSYDPGNRFTVPWQSGITGIGYDPELTGREITSFKDLLDTEFEGKVGMFGDTLDLPNLTLAGIGINPEESTPDDWQEAADVLTKQRDDGIVRKYYTQNYIQALQAGDVALSTAWSGDIFQAQNSGSPQLEFVVPEEGGILWTDNMCIPAEAQHPVDAITMMDFVYQPQVAAMLTEWINYISPVPDAQQIVLDDAAKASGADKAYLQAVAESPLVFPTEEIYTRTYSYRVLEPEEQEEWNSVFQPIYQA